MRAHLILLLTLTGCISHWQSQAGPPTLVVNRSSAAQLRVLRTDGRRLTVEHARIEGDSLIGSLEPDGPWPAPAPRIAIAVADIRSIDEQEPDLVASVAVGILVTLAVLVAVIRLGL